MTRLMKLPPRVVSSMKANSPLATVGWIVVLAIMFIGWGMMMILVFEWFDAFGL